MKIIDPGNPEASHPHRCKDALWKFEDAGRPNVGAVVECSCGAHWRVQSKLGFRGSLGSWNITYRGSAYWVRIKKGK